jgi:hypothetical protein
MWNEVHGTMDVGNGKDESEKVILCLGRGDIIKYVRGRNWSSKIY